jgi:hypothetical protein
MGLRSSLRSRPLTHSEIDGYVVWGLAGLVIVVPELWATISTPPLAPLTGVLGHLSGPWKFIVAFLILSFSGQSKVGHDPPQPSHRLTSVQVPRIRSRLYYPVGLLLVAGPCLVVAATSDSKWLLAYTCYGMLAAATVIIPTALAFVLARFVVFPTFHRTLMDLSVRFPLTAQAIDNGTRLLRLG